MPRRFGALAVAGLVLVGSNTAEAAAVKERRPVRSTDQPRPRDGNIAIQEELDAARRAGTLAAYDLFIRRHGDHPLVPVARQERAALAAAAKP